MLRDIQTVEESRITGHDDNQKLTRMTANKINDEIMYSYVYTLVKPTKSKTLDLAILLALKDDTRIEAKRLKEIVKFGAKNVGASLFDNVTGKKAVLLNEEELSALRNIDVILKKKESFIAGKVADADMAPNSADMFRLLAFAPAIICLALLFAPGVSILAFVISAAVASVLAAISFTRGEEIAKRSKKNKLKEMEASLGKEYEKDADLPNADPSDKKSVERNVGHSADVNEDTLREKLLDRKSCSEEATGFAMNMNKLTQQVILDFTEDRQPLKRSIRISIENFTPATVKCTKKVRAEESQRKGNVKKSFANPESSEEQNLGIR